MHDLDLVDLLNVEFERRQEKNIKYSLRAFARDLGVHAATLSHIIKRKRVPVLAFRKKIYQKLKLSVDQITYLETRPDEVFRFTKMEMDIFLSLSNWYYDAIVELLRTKGFKSEVSYVAKKLGITQEEANTALNRLFQLGIIKKMPNKTWIASTENTIAYGGDQTNFALQKLQREIMEKAIVSLEKIPKINREQASMVMAINQNDLPEVKKRIKEFQQELCKFLQRPNREANEVFQLVTAFFPLTVKDKN